MDDFERDLIEWQRNNTSESTESTNYFLLFEQMPTFLVILIVAGLLTNGTLLYLLKKTKVCNTPNVFIFNLTIGNLLVLLLKYPFDAAKFFTVPLYPFGDFICKSTESFYWVSLGVSSFSLTVLGAHSLLDERRCGGNTVIVVIWALAVLFALPTMVLAEAVNTRTDDIPELLCMSFKYRYEIVEVLNRLVLCVAVPLIVVGGFYVSNKIKRNATSAKCSKLAFLMLAFCGICIVPGLSAELFFLHNYHYNDTFLVFIHVSLTCVQFAYPCLSPVALCCASGNIRKLFKQHLIGCRKANHEVKVSERDQPLQPLV